MPATARPRLLVKTAAGLAYAAEIGADVVSTSLGGPASAAWADAVNRAYETGVLR